MRQTAHRERPYAILISGFLAVALAGGLLWSAGVHFIVMPKPAFTPDQPVSPPRITRLFAALTPVAWAYPANEAEKTSATLLVDNFENMPVGGFPRDWKAWRGDNQYVQKLYIIREENGNRYLGAQDDGASIIIRKELRKWNPHEYPILSWRWRAKALPQGGDERNGLKNDSAAAVFVVLDQNFFGIPKTLKYVWSTTLPVGTRHRREGIGRPTVIVLESGSPKVGQWVTETINVYEDFVRTFGGPPPKNAIGIGILTDNNSTKSASQGDYDDFLLHRRESGF